MKRLILCVLVSLSLTACGSGDKEDADNKTQTVEQASQQAKPVLDKASGPSEIEMMRIVSATAPVSAGIRITEFKKRGCEAPVGGKVYCSFFLAAERRDPQTNEVEKSAAEQSGFFWQENGKWNGEPGERREGVPPMEVPAASVTTAKPQSSSSANTNAREPDESEMRLAIEASKPSGLNLTIVNFKKGSCEEKKKGMFFCSFTADVQGTNPQTGVIERTTYEQIAVFRMVNGKWTSNPS